MKAKILFLSVAFSFNVIATPTTDLLHAIWSKDLASVNAAIFAGAELDYVDAHRYNLIHFAVVAEFPQAIRLLAISTHVDLFDDKGQTPAHLAASNGDVVSLAQLDACGADFSMRDWKGNRAIDLARNWGHHDAVAFLAPLSLSNISHAANSNNALQSARSFFRRALSFHP